MVDEEVVQPEDGVAGGCVHVAHDAADAVVAVGVRAALSASRHVLEGRVDIRVVARVDPVLVGVLGKACVAVALQAMGTGVAGAGTDVDADVGELLRFLLKSCSCVIGGFIAYPIGHTSTVHVGKRTKVLGREDRGLGEASRPLGLIPPRHLAVEAALRAQELLKCPHKVSVPQQELCVGVDVGGELLVQRCEIFVFGPRGRVSSRSRPSL